jgi:hypothetical protein
MSFRRFINGKHLDVWQAFAREIGGAYSPPHGHETGQIEVAYANGAARGTLRIEGQVVMVSVGKVPVPVASTRFSVLLPSIPAHRFSVSRATFASAVADWFGALDIHVDDDAFDRAFVLKGETPDLVRELFADAELRARFISDFEGQMHRRDDTALFSDPTPGLDPFELSVPGFVDSMERMRALWTLFVHTFDRLPHGATDSAPR